ncbi:MAG: MerR family transcriptional regulator, partial [Acidimicrobiaceae bacterium]
MSTARNYLSIGEVLALLLEEFPDVTISKIRFLESQGLIEPERTASGYRKFSQGEVDRLTFILREQRENYLPLKVIRTRLEGDTSDGLLRDDEITAPRGLGHIPAPRGQG